MRPSSSANSLEGARPSTAPRPVAGRWRSASAVGSPSRLRRVTVIRACLTGIRTSMAELLDSHPRHGVIVKASVTMLHLGRAAHLAGEPPLGLPCRVTPWSGPDCASFGGVGRLGKFSPAVNHPTRHRPARRRRTGRSRTFSGTVTTPTVLAGTGVGCPPVGHEVCTHHRHRAPVDCRTHRAGRAGHGPARGAGAAPGRRPPRPDPAARTRCKLDDEDHRP